jgi:hypothetical protein
MTDKESVSRYNEYILRDRPTVEQNRFGESETETPYAVNCREHQLVFLTHVEYDCQMNDADDEWRCPRCRSTAVWDDDNYELFIFGEEDNDEDLEEDASAF